MLAVKLSRLALCSSSLVLSNLLPISDRSWRPCPEHKHIAALDHQENSAPQQLHESRFEGCSS